MGRPGEHVVYGVLLEEAAALEEAEDAALEKGRIRLGTESTHWRTGSGGRTWSPVLPCLPEREGV